MVEPPWWDPDAEHWPDWIQWWTDPRLALAVGLRFGYDMGRRDAERERVDDTLRALARARRGGDG